MHLPAHAIAVSLRGSLPKVPRSRIARYAFDGQRATPTSRIARRCLTLILIGGRTREASRCRFAFSYFADALPRGAFR
jgi:hypothetical protein